MRKFAHTLNVFLLVDQEHIPAWQRLMLKRLLIIRQIRLAAIIFSHPTPNLTPSPLHTLLLHPLRWMDEKLLGHPLNAAKPDTFLDLLEATPVFNISDEHYREKLAAPDVIIDLSESAPPPDDILIWARYGVWQHFFSSNADTDSYYTGIREYVSCQQEIVSGIQRWTTEQATPETFFYASSSLGTIPLYSGIEHTLWRMADFIPQRLQELACLGDELFIRNNRNRLRNFPQQYLPANPGIVTTLQALSRYTREFLVKLYQRLLWQERWILLVGHLQETDNIGRLENFHRLEPPGDRFWADPFLVEHEGAQYIFFEEMIFKRGIGHLSYMRLEADGSFSKPCTILQKPYHLSYPFIFLYQNTYYLIPETAHNHTIELYRCENFPHQWVWEKNLMENVDAFDTTLVEYEGRWWMFANIRTHPGCSSSEALYLFHADSPLSNNWKAHPQNPVETRVTHARPAGRIFRQDGVLYRPSQNCAGSYGRGLNINRIRQLDINSYQEETTSTYLPEGQCGFTGLHTLNREKDLCVLDACTHDSRYHIQTSRSYSSHAEFPAFRPGKGCKHHI